MMDKGINKALLRQVIQTLERERILKSNLSIEDYKVHFTQIILKKNVPIK